jgi:uncharacterized membrane protein YeaQ/YmgE (transglycosylase-associated protein family)
MLIALFWITFGALVGAIVSILQGKMDVRTISVYALLGIIGGILGGFFSDRLPAQTAGYDSGVTSLMFAVFGALILSALVGNSTDDPPGQKR